MTKQRRQALGHPRRDASHEGRILCMKGGIYTEEKCSICGGGMKDTGRFVGCPVHSKQRATTFIVRFGRQIFKRFSNYDMAERFLNGVRFKTDEGSYDVRDYQQDNPLGFRTLSEKYLDIKSQLLKPDSYRAIKSHMRRADDFFVDRNVKEIHYGDLEDFFLAQKDISSKTVKNIRTTMHSFFMWLVRRRVIRREQVPEFPEWSYELGYRKTVDKESQARILAEIMRLSETNPRAYTAIRWLCTYVNLRPGDLRGILEEDVDLKRGIVLIKTHKTSKSTHKIKVIPLLLEDIEELKSLPTAFPKMPLFRWDTGGHGRSAGRKFGENYLYKLWIKACKNLGIEGVDLYGGTRHSSAQALRNQLTPEAIKRLTGHDTNKAFERYFQVSLDELREGYQMTRTNSAPPIHGCNTKNEPKSLK